MTTFDSRVAGDGPIVRVEVSFARATIAKLRAAGRPVLPPLELDALIDTGADASLIDHGLLTPFVREGMELNAVVPVNAPGLGGFSWYPQFVAGLRVKHPTGPRSLDLVLPAAELVERPFGTTTFQVLIGRDILARCRFVYDGPANTFSLTY